MKFKIISFLFLTAAIFSCNNDAKQTTKPSREIASELFFNEKKQEALVEINRVIESTPDSVDLENRVKDYYLRSMIYDSLEEFQQEIDDLTKILNLKKDKKILFAHFERAKIYSKIGKNEKALRDVNYTLENKNHFIGGLESPYNIASAYLLKGSILYKVDEIDESRHYYELALKRNNDTVKTIKAQGLVGLSNTTLNKSKRLEMLNRAMEISKDDAFAYGARGVYYFEENEPLKAKQDFRKSLDLEPNNSTVLYNMAQLYTHDLKQKDSAIFYYNRTLELSPNFNKKTIIENNLKAFKENN